MVEGDAHPRSCHAINHQRYRQAAVLLIGGNIGQLGQLLQLRDEPAGPEVQFVRVRIFQRVLVLRAADAVVDGDVLHRRHVQDNPLHLLQVLISAVSELRRKH